MIIRWRKWHVCPSLLNAFWFLLEAAPEFTVPEETRRRNIIAVPVGYSVRLDCSAFGFPRPTVKWYKDGVIFQERKRGSRLYISKSATMLTMKDIVPSDSGLYTCNVSNAYGWINHSYRVDVHGKRIEWYDMIKILSSLKSQTLL